MTNQKDDKSVCQCLSCGNVFNFSERNRNGWHTFGGCPKCGRAMTIIRHANKSDEAYLDQFVYS